MNNSNKYAFMVAIAAEIKELVHEVYKPTNITGGPTLYSIPEKLAQWTQKSCESWYNKQSFRDVGTSARHPQ